MRKREYFVIRQFARRYDRRTGKFVINIAYKTKTDITDHTVAVAEAFGLGISDFQQHIICDDVELKVGRGGGQLMSPKFFRWNIFKVR
jgi:hypothetical protein